MGKRAIDLVVGTVLAVAVTPAVLVLALVLAVQYRAWPFFTQERLGRHRVPFRIVKLRTLPPQSPRYADKYEVRQMPLPRLARVLRHFHLDELPQLWLVPTGRMSLVGPRPEMAFLHDRLPPEVATTRLSVRPGCTGLWQVSRDSGRLIHEHPEYDLTYVTNHSTRLDVWILWLTARELLGRPRRVTLQALPSWVTPAHPAAVPTAEEPVAA